MKYKNMKEYIINKIVILLKLMNEQADGWHDVT